jgi:cytochrome c biogenesis protein CcmG/thiol:disulfide interchange protein DsbE
MADTSSSGSKTGLIIGAVGGLVVLLLVAAVMFGSEEVGAEYGEPEISGTALTRFPSTESIDFTAAGQVAPDVLGKNYDDSVVTITNDGTAKAIVFLAHWCSHCQAEVPRVQQWLNETGGVEGVDIYSVSTAINSGRPNYPGSTWLDNENWTVPVVVDDQESSVLTAYGSGGFPYWVFLNADGTVALRTAGELSIAQLEEFLNTLEQ